jgi:aspartyl-tRNA synthetase
VRDLGGLIFIDLRDRYGITQLVVSQLNESDDDLAARARELHQEYVISASGTVRMRENPNLNIPTGMIEILLDDILILNKAELPPFEIINELETSEEIRLKYRFLDLRRPVLQRNFVIRNKLYQVVHQYFLEHNFLEIETPVLMKSTPEGARDFLVPSRINKGKFYALPQSPQIFKQILMISGFDRYMQIVKCFRDEDLRSDRQPEFTQIDIEMSFIERDDLMEIIEGFIKRTWRELLGIEVRIPIQRMSYKEAMMRFGSDKPDVRFALEIKTITDIVRHSGFGVFSSIASSGGVIAAINAPGCAGYSRKQLDELTELARKYGAKGLSWIKLSDGGINSPIAKFLGETELRSIVEVCDAKEGDLLLVVADEWKRCFTVLGALRLEIARQIGILNNVKNDYKFLWVVDFPLLEFDEVEKRYTAMHHPFTSPVEEDIALLELDPKKVRAQAYDLVVNGIELGGGSIRIHRNELQQKMFGLLGMDQEEAERRFGFLLKALQYGAPPHGGIAFGLDRIVMVLAGTDNIRDVIAFPKTTSGLSLMDGSPSEVDEGQLKELGIRLMKGE